MGCCSSPPAPDTSGQVASAAASERLGNRQLDLAERQYESDRATQAEFLDFSRANAATDTELKGLQIGLAREDGDRRREIFNPLEAQIVTEAKEYDSAGRVDQAVGRADSAVVQAYEKATRNAQADQLRLGINPNSAKALALRENADVQIALGAASAGTAEANRVKDRGLALRFDAAGLGRNLSTNQVASVDSAVRAGQSGVNSLQAANEQGNRNFDSTTRGFASAGASFANAGSAYGSAAKTQAEGGGQSEFGKLVGYGVKSYLGSTQ